MRSLLSNCALYFFKFFRISCCCFTLSNVGRRGRHCSPQKFSILSRFKIFPWNDQIQKPVSTFDFQYETAVTTYRPVGSHSTSEHEKCSVEFMILNSFVSTNSNVPPRLRRPAKTMNWPDGAQNSELQAFFSNRLSKDGVWPVLTP